MCKSVVSSSQMLNIPTKLVTREEVDHKECGRIVRAVRAERNITGKRLAELLGVSAAYVCGLEHGKRKWTPQLYVKILTVIQNNTNK